MKEGCRCLEDRKETGPGPSKIKDNSKVQEAYLALHHSVRRLLHKMDPVNLADLFSGPVLFFI